MLINESLGYHNLKLYEQSSYLTTFSCPFGGTDIYYCCFGIALASDIFQRKIDETVQGLPVVFGTADAV